MIKIQTRLFIYFAVIMLTIVTISYIQNQNNQKVFNIYDESMDRFFLLNEVAVVSNNTMESLNIYVLEVLPENLAKFQENKNQIVDLQKQLIDTNRYDEIRMKNYQEIISSFLKHIEQTVNGINEKNIQLYSYHLNEAEITAGYVQEMTQNLINEELTSFQTIYYSLKQQIDNTKKMGVSIFISIILLSILFAIWFSNGITRTIKSLTKAAEKISEGCYSGEDVQVSRKDELSFLTQTFNEMKKNIYHSVKEIEEKSKLAQLLKETELRSLQNQINPHFLFNTLNTISKTAYIEGADRTSELISSVSALLRYNLGNLTRPTVLADEIQIVKDYFFIQKSRFAERVEFLQDIDPQCLHTPIPCLTLQPIVENAFIHGIEDMSEGARIELKIFQDHFFVFIEIRDNGRGMEKETIAKLLKSKDSNDLRGGENKGHSNGIGMSNVVERLKLFNKDSGVSITSKVGQGTTVTIKINKQTTSLG